MSAISIALVGLETANTQLNNAAAQIADYGTDSASGNGPVDVVDLSSEMVALMTSQNSFDANLATLKTADQMQKAVVDITT